MASGPGTGVEVIEISSVAFGRLGGRGWTDTARRAIQSDGRGGESGLRLGVAADNHGMRRLLWELARVECARQSHQTVASRLLAPGEAQKAERLVSLAAALLETRSRSRDSGECWLPIVGTPRTSR